MANETGLTVAVTGPTGTFGLALMPLLQEDQRVDSIIGIARRPFDPAERSWTKMEYRPSIMDTTKAKTQLGWKPRHTAIESLRATVL